MTLEDLDQLEQVRLKATPGPYEATGLEFGCFYIMARRENMVADQGEADGILRMRGYGAGLPMKANAEYFAALSPEVVGELVRLAREALNVHKQLKESATTRGRS